jgi:hypothetical protein
MLPVFHLKISKNNSDPMAARKFGIFTIELIAFDRDSYNYNIDSSCREIRCDDLSSSDYTKQNSCPHG